MEVGLQIVFPKKEEDEADVVVGDPKAELPPKIDDADCWLPKVEALVVVGEPKNDVDERALAAPNTEGELLGEPKAEVVVDVPKFAPPPNRGLADVVAPKNEGLVTGVTVAPPNTEAVVLGVPLNADVEVVVGKLADVVVIVEPKIDAEEVETELKFWVFPKNDWVVVCGVLLPPKMEVEVLIPPNTEGVVVLPKNDGTLEVAGVTAEVEESGKIGADEGFPALLKTDEVENVVNAPVLLNTEIEAVVVVATLDTVVSVVLISNDVVVAEVWSVWEFEPLDPLLVAGKLNEDPPIVEPLKIEASEETTDPNETTVAGAALTVLVVEGAGIPLWVVVVEAGLPKFIEEIIDDVVVALAVVLAPDEVVAIWELEGVLVAPNIMLGTFDKEAVADAVPNNKGDVVVLAGVVKEPPKIEDAVVFDTLENIDSDNLEDESAADGWELWLGEGFNLVVAFLCSFDDVCWGDNEEAKPEKFIFDDGAVLGVWAKDRFEPGLWIGLLNKPEPVVLVTTGVIVSDDGNDKPEPELENKLTFGGDTVVLADVIWVLGAHNIGELVAWEIVELTIGACWAVDVTEAVRWVGLEAPVETVGGDDEVLAKDNFGLNWKLVLELNGE